MLWITIRCNKVQYSAFFRMVIRSIVQALCSALVLLGLSVSMSCGIIQLFSEMKPEVCMVYCGFLYFPWYTEKVCIIFWGILWFAEKTNDQAPCASRLASNLVPIISDPVSMAIQKKVLSFPPVIKKLYIAIPLGSCIIQPSTNERTFYVDRWI